VRRGLLPLALAGGLCWFVIHQGADPRNTVWQASISLGVYFTIQMNGAGLVHGWLFGAFVQVLNVSYGVVTHQWAFTLSLLGMVGFLEVWYPKWRARTGGRSGDR
jgi:hypothetical protein